LEDRAKNYMIHVKTFYLKGEQYVREAFLK
jgi:hypothetical protein